MMFSMLFKASVGFLFITSQICVSNGLEDIWKDAKRLKKGNKRGSKRTATEEVPSFFEHPQTILEGYPKPFYEGYPLDVSEGNPQVILEGYPQTVYEGYPQAEYGGYTNYGGYQQGYNDGSTSFSNNFELNPLLRLDSNHIINEPYDASFTYNNIPDFSYRLEGESSYNPYQQHGEELQRVNVHFLSIPTQAIQTEASTLAQGEHNFISVLTPDVRSHDVRKNCELHYERRGVQKLVTTKCETCNVFYCPECHQLKHGLAHPPTLPPYMVQKCIHCNTTLGINPERLVDHTNLCPLIPHTLNVKNNKIFPYSCYACDYQHEDRVIMKKHVISHTQLRPNKCYKCGKRFKDSPYFKKHVEQCYNKH